MNWRSRLLLQQTLGQCQSGPAPLPVTGEVGKLHWLGAARDRLLAESRNRAAGHRIMDIAVRHPSLVEGQDQPTPLQGRVGGSSAVSPDPSLWRRIVVPLHRMVELFQPQPDRLPPVLLRADSVEVDQGIARGVWRSPKSTPLVPCKRQRNGGFGVLVAKSSVTSLPPAVRINVALSSLCAICSLAKGWSLA